MWSSGAFGDRPAKRIRGRERGRVNNELRNVATEGRPQRLLNR